MNEGRQVEGVHGVRDGVKEDRGDREGRNEVGEASAWGRSCGEGGSAGGREGGRGYMKGEAGR